MRRPIFTLAIAICSLSLNAAAKADGKVLRQVLGNKQQLLIPNGAGNGPVGPGISNGPQFPQGRPPIQSRQLVLDPTQPNQLAYFSPRLGARFLVQQMYLPQFGNFWAARIVSEPAWDSPLRQLGLEEGDVITRLDGLPVMNTQELERHVLDTGVRYIKAGTQQVVQAKMFIQPHNYFTDPWAPNCPHHPGVGNVAIRP